MFSWLQKLAGWLVGLRPEATGLRQEGTGPTLTPQDSSLKPQVSSLAPAFFSQETTTTFTYPPGTPAALIKQEIAAMTGVPVENVALIGSDAVPLELLAALLRGIHPSIRGAALRYRDRPADLALIAKCRTSIAQWAVATRVCQCLLCEASRDYRRTGASLN